MTAGSIKPKQPIEADAVLMDEARANCAARLRSRGSEAEAAIFETAQRDDAWAMRHEIAKLQSERKAGK